MFSLFFVLSGNFYVWALATKYGEASAAAACEMYDSVAQAAGKNLPPAEPAATATYAEVAKTVRGMMKQSGNTGFLSSGVEKLVKQAGADTTLKNAIRDGAEFAWIPHGDTCAFCITLASNGWRQASKKVLRGDHADHIHAHCDCEFAVRFDGKPTYKDYDPDKYREMYDKAEGSSWQEKVNSMRRETYSVHKEEINAQKREAYAIRRGLSAGHLSGKISGGRYTWESTVPSAKRSIKQGFEAFPEGDILKTRVKKLKPDGNKFDVVMHGTPVGVGFGTENPSMTARDLAKVIRNDPTYHGQSMRLLACDTGRPEKDGDYCFAEELANSLGVTVEAPNDQVFFLPNGSWYVGYPGNTTPVILAPNQRRRLK